MKQLFNRVYNHKKKRRNKNEYIETREVDTSRGFELEYYDEIEIRLTENIREHSSTGGSGGVGQYRQRWTIKIPKTQHYQKPADELVKNFVDLAIQYRSENSALELSGGHERDREAWNNVLMKLVNPYDEDFLGTNYQPVKKIAE